jgi:hypothetical protein
MGRWQCDRQRVIDDMISEMAREMYLRDWKRAMLKVHFIIEAFQPKYNI